MTPHTLTWEALEAMTKDQLVEFCATVRPSDLNWRLHLAAFVRLTAMVCRAKGDDREAEAHEARYAELKARASKEV